MQAKLLEKIQQRFQLELLPDQKQAVLQVGLGQIREVLKFCRDDAELAMDLLLDVIAVDYLGQEPRFELNYPLLSSKYKHRLRLKLCVAEGEAVPSVSDLYPSADWAEREVFDMFGVKFTNHPNLKRILMFESFEGHPLRKDYPVNRRQKIPVINEIP